MSENSNLPTENKMDIELLKKDVVQLNRFYSEFSKTIDKLKEAADRMNNIVSIQERRFAEQERRNAEMDKELTEYKLDQIRAMTNAQEKMQMKLDAMEKNFKLDLINVKIELSDKINELNKWKYMLTGIAAVLSFLLATFLDVFKIFKG